MSVRSLAMICIPLAIKCISLAMIFIPLAIKCIPLATSRIMETKYLAFEENIASF